MEEVPKNGDVAHRQGFRLDQNPFQPGGSSHMFWAEGWKLRERCRTGPFAEAGTWVERDGLPLFEVKGDSRAMSVERAATLRRRIIDLLNQHGEG